MGLDSSDIWSTQPYIWNTYMYIYIHIDIARSPRSCWVVLWGSLMQPNTLCFQHCFGAVFQKVRDGVSICLRSSLRITYIVMPISNPRPGTFHFCSLYLLLLRRYQYHYHISYVRFRRIFESQNITGWTWVKIGEIWFFLQLSVRLGWGPWAHFLGPNMLKKDKGRNYVSSWDRCCSCSFLWFSLSMLSILSSLSWPVPSSQSCCWWWLAAGAACSCVC